MIPNQPSTDDSVLNRLLFLGTHSYKWDDLGVDVVYEMQQAGTEESIQRQVSGLDQRARDVCESILRIVHSLRNIGTYDFDGGNFNKKLEFISGLKDPVFELFRQKYVAATLDQQQAFKKALEELKKGQTILSSDPNGNT